MGVGLAGQDAGRRVGSVARTWDARRTERGVSTRLPPHAERRGPSSSRPPRRNVSPRGSTLVIGCPGQPSRTSHAVLRSGAWRSHRCRMDALGENADAPEQETDVVRPDSDKGKPNITKQHRTRGARRCRVWRGPSGNPAFCRHRSTVRTPGSQPENVGSIPAGGTTPDGC